MKKILKRYNEPFSTEIRQPRNRILKIIAQEKEVKKNLFGFLSSSPVDFKEVSVSEEKIVINVTPRISNPYRGMGMIHMSLRGGKTSSETKIEGEIIPYNSLYLFTVYAVIGFLVIWSAFVFATTSGINIYVMLAFSWTLFPLVLYLIPLWNRSVLREYKDIFLVILEANKKKSLS